MYLRIFALFMLCTLTSMAQAAKVGLCIVATEKYMPFSLELIDSARRFFCAQHKVTYFVFSNKPIPSAPDIVPIYYEHMVWPLSTLMRVHAYMLAHDALKKMDYVFACDADMIFVAPVGGEIFSQRVGTLHPGYYNKKRPQFSYEKKQKNSTAYVKPSEGTHYFCGGFYGGTAQEFLQMIKIMKNNIHIDLKHNIISKLHH